MPYSQFTIEKAKRDLKLTIVEGVRFFPDTIAPITLSPRLETILEDLHGGTTPRTLHPFECVHTLEAKFATR